MCPPAGPPLGTAEPDRGPVSRVLQPRTEKDMDPNTVEAKCEISLYSECVLCSQGNEFFSL